MSDENRSEKSGWSILGFFNANMGDDDHFRRLIILLGVVTGLLLTTTVLLLTGYLLVKGDVTRWYEHMTRTTPGWAQCGIPPGGVTVVLGAAGHFRHRRKVRANRSGAARKELPEEGRAAQLKPEQTADQRDDSAGEIPGGHPQHHGDADPDRDS